MAIQKDAIMEDKDTILDKKATTPNIIAPNNVATGSSAANMPRPVATPLPPLNFKNIV